MLPENAAIRTSAKYDDIVRHYGYEPFDPPPGDIPASIPTDVELVADAQRRLAQFKVIPDEYVQPAQLVNLQLVRAITQKNCPGGRAPAVYAAEIPGASDRVITAGMYSKHDRKIYAACSQLYRGKTAVEMGIHEVAHHTSGGDDGESGHDAEMSQVADRVIEQVRSGMYDEFINRPEFTW